MTGKEIIDAYNASVLERFISFRDTGESIGEIEHIMEWFKREGVEPDLQLQRYSLKMQLKNMDDLRAAGFTLVEEDAGHEAQLRANVAKWEAEDAESTSTTGVPSSPAEPSGN